MKIFFNQEVQAFIRIGSKNSGEFQFGLVSGQLNGKLVKYSEGDKFEFMWEGNDECDSAHGSGWIRLKNKKTMEGEFWFYDAGDDSKFEAKKITKK
ncbi:MAG: hypothetical protein WCG27_03785 [Pseudomonadota bacterium]